MSAIPAASVGVKTMADGTLRITFDIEPSDAGAAFALFGKPGTPAALAALAVGYAKAPEVPPEAPKGGPLAREAAQLCKSEAFRKWLSGDGPACDEAAAAEHMRDQLGIESRAELDTDERAAAEFVKRFRVPFMRAHRT